MRLRNKKTGEIYDFKITPDYDDVMSGWKIENKDFGVRYYSHLAELNDEWEDYEEPKAEYIIDYMEEDCIYNAKFGADLEDIERAKELGIWFETKEETERAAEKLKAWQRLRDKGFRFEGIKEDYTRILQSQDPFRTGKRYLQFNKSEDEEWMKENWKDLYLLFGGEE